MEKKDNDISLSLEQKKPLRFIHITRSAGTTIENIGYKKKKLWGRFDRDYANINKFNKSIPWFKLPIFCKNYENYDWFMVVRNPYNRIISECNCPYYGKGRSIKYLTKNDINQYIRYRIRNRLASGSNYTEQFKYLFNEDSKVKQHILKYENLVTDFSELMKEYDLNLEINWKEPPIKHFNINDLSKETRQLINKTYKKDFEIFNYDLIPEKPLKFIHITKCAGTSIENVANKKNILWGRFDLGYGDREGESPPWHNILRKTKYLDHYDWFMIVRNPYSRLVSEFHCKWGGVGDTIDLHTKKSFNEYILNKIKIRNINMRGDHYTPQHRYLVKNSNVKIHVIKLENLKNEFSPLMNKYNLDIVLDISINKNSKKFTVDDLESKTIEIINQVYDQDFKEFDYDKIL